MILVKIFLCLNLKSVLKMAGGRGLASMLDQMDVVLDSGKRMDHAVIAVGGLMICLISML